MDKLIKILALSFMKPQKQLKITFVFQPKKRKIKSKKG